MGPMNFHRVRGNWKALSAALGAGVFVTMGAVTLAHPAMEADTTPGSWKAAQSITLIPATRAQPSFAPTVIADPCTMTEDHPRVHHEC